MASGGGGGCNNDRSKLKLIECSLREFVIKQRLQQDFGDEFELDADASLYPYLEAVLTSDEDDAVDDDDSVLELIRAYVPLLESVSDGDLRRWLEDCRRCLVAEAETGADAPCNGSQPDVVVEVVRAVGRTSQSESSTVSTGSSTSYYSSTSMSDADAAEAEALERLRALFPTACAGRLRLKLGEAGGDLQQAAGLCLEVADDQDGLACPKPPCACLAPKSGVASAPNSSVTDVKSYIMSRFENYELPDERKTHRPEARFDERPRLTRYLDSRVVAQNGARYVEIKDEREEEIRKATTVCLKPARKYRFH